MRDEDRIVQNILQLGGFLYRTGTRMTEVFGLNQQQFVLLYEIVSRSRVTQKQLVADLLLEKSNVSKIVKKLRSAEYINVQVSLADRRATVLSPTQRGREASSRCMAILNDWNSEWLSSYSEKEKQQTVDTLERLKTLV